MTCRTFWTQSISGSGKHEGKRRHHPFPVWDRPRPRPSPAGPKNPRGSTDRPFSPLRALAVCDRLVCAAAWEWAWEASEEASEADAAATGAAATVAVVSEEASAEAASAADV